MNLKRALAILELREEEATENAIRKAYRSKILQFHPDKNKSPDAPNKFLEIQSAYKFLQVPHNMQEDDSVDKSYNDILKTFLATIFQEETTPLISKIVELICKKICLIVEHNVEHILDYLRTINHDTLRIIYNVLLKYRSTLHLSSELIERIDELLHKKECIILNPSLDDLLSEENVYILKRDDHSYLVPLWQHEMVFDHSGTAFTVKCFPILPDNMELDEWNNLTVTLQYNYREVWDTDIAVQIGSKQFLIQGHKLKLTSTPQLIEYFDCGVPYNHSDNILDTAKKQSVIFIITICI